MTRAFQFFSEMWNELSPSPILAARVGDFAPSLVAFVGNIKQYTFDNTDDVVYGATEITHEYKEGSAIEAHIHWAPQGMEESDKYVKWELEYQIANLDGVFSESGILSVEALIASGTDDRKHILSTFGNIQIGAWKIGAIIVWKLRRVVVTGEHLEPVADPFALAVGFHCLFNTIGSRELAAK